MLQLLLQLLQLLLQLPKIKDKKKKKDPNAPKKAKTSYIFFCTEMRDQVCQDFPGMKVPVVGKELGRRWNSLEATERLKYEQMAAEDRKRVAGEKETYEESIVRAQKAVKVSSKNEEDELNEAPEKSKAAGADISDAEDKFFEFFWTERLGDGCQEKPSQYHVTFFDDKVVRKWVACSRLSKFDQKKPNIPRTARGSRLLKAFTRAVEASKESLEVRREKYCFAQLYKGKWGPVWDECGSERVDLHLDVGAGNISHNVRSLRDRGAVAGQSSQAESPNKLSIKSQPCQEVAESSRTKTDNENLLPLLQELANQQGLSQDSELLTVSFGEVDEDEALTKQIGEFILDTKLFTPIKRSGPERCDGAPPCKSLLLTSTPVKPETPLSL